MTITAKYEDGVFKPLENVRIIEGTIVEVRVPSDAGRPESKAPSVVRPGVKEHHLCRFDEQRPHRRGRGEKLYRSFYMQ